MPVAASVLVILLPMLCFPQSFDHAMYLRGADCLLQGGHLYRDYIDIKPPLLYYFFAFVRLVGGHGEMGFRAVDVAYQTLSACLLGYLSFALFRDRVTAAATTILYALSYIAPGFAEVMQPDTIATPLFATLVLYLLRPPEGKYGDIIIGFVCALLFSLKYTFGVALPFALIVIRWLPMNSGRSFLQRVGQIVLGMIPGLLLGFFAFFDAPTREAYTQVLDFLRAYTAHPAWDFKLFKTALKAFGSYIGDMLSLSIVFLSVIGVLPILTAPRTDQPDHGSRSVARSQVERVILPALLLLVVFLWASVVVEKKFLVNHFMRAFVPIMLLSGVGFASLLRAVRAHPPITTARRIVWGSLVLLGLLFSPLPRWLSQVRLAELYTFNHRAYDSMFEDPSRISFERVQVHQVRDYILSHRREGDRTFVMGVGIIPLYDELREPVWSRLGASCFYFADDAPLAWVMDMHNDLQKADWLVVATRDNNPVTTANGRSSKESLERDSTASAIVSAQFDKLLELRSIELYKRHRN